MLLCMCISSSVSHDLPTPAGTSQSDSRISSLRDYERIQLIHALTPSATHQSTTATNLLPSYSSNLICLRHHTICNWPHDGSPQPRKSRLKTAIPNSKLKKLPNLNSEWAFCQTLVVYPCRSLGGGALGRAVCKCGASRWWGAVARVPVPLAR